MNVDDLDYHLPEELIAQHPVYPRDYARLMVLDRRLKTISHRVFYKITEYLKPGDIMVLNDSKVIKARFIGSNKKTGGKREVFLLKRLDDFTWRALTAPSHRCRVGDVITVSVNPLIEVEIVEKNYDGESTLKFSSSDNLSMIEILRIAGEVPLPPYIKGKLGAEDEYQTVFSVTEGSVASPTAGLHFTRELIDSIKAMGVLVEYITLHVGLGTFKPIKEKDLNKHRMHREDFVISKETANRINEAKREGGRLFACGTTVVRALETASSRSGQIKPFSGSTCLFIKPGYKFKAVDAIITNFHFPKTTLIALVCAFAGREFVLEAYDQAVKEHYRFFSFGDAMLIL